MEYAYLFYLISILDSVKLFLTQAEFLFGVIAMAALCAALFFYVEMYTVVNSSEYLSMNDKIPDEKKTQYVSIYKSRFKTWSWITVLTFVLSLLIGISNTLLPSKKDTVTIVAGIGVMEAVHSDVAKSVASKSVAIVEKWLDDQLKDTGNEMKEAVKGAVNDAVTDTKKSAVKAVKGLVDDKAEEGQQKQNK